MQSPCHSLTPARKYSSYPQPITDHMSPEPSSTELQPYAAITSRPKAENTTELGNTSIKSKRTSSPGTPHLTQSHRLLSPTTYESPPPPTRAQSKPIHRVTRAHMTQPITSHISRPPLQQSSWPNPLPSPSNHTAMVNCLLYHLAA